MPHNAVLLKAVSTVGAGQSEQVPPDDSNRSLVVSVGGVAGAVSATVAYEVSNDLGVTWAPRLVFTLSGTSTLTAPVADSDTDPNGPFPLVRGNVTAVTGGGLVSLSMCAAGRGAA